MVIDCHAHLWVSREAGPDGAVKSVAALLAACDRVGIDRVAVSGLGPRYNTGTNADVEAAVRRHPDRLIGMGTVWLGQDGPDVVRDLADRGFRGLKVIAPAVPYDDPKCFPVYEAAADLRLPILFHLGILSRSPLDRYYDVSMARMRPVYLDPIARRFPELVLIGAHFGNPWYEEAAEIARMHENVYFDLTGSTLKKKSPAYFKELLWWDRTQQYRGPGGKGPFEKILFGTDVAYPLMEDVRADYEQFMDGCGLSASQRADILGRTAGRLFGLCLP